MLLLLLSCKEEKKQFFQTGDCSNIDTYMLGNDFTIFCYIDSTNCTTCAMQWLTRWLYFEDELKKLKTGIVLIVRNANEDAVHNTLTQLRLNYPVVFDDFSNIRRKNEIILNQYSTFAVNNKKEVVWLGIPIESEASWNSFRKMLQ